MDFERWDAKQNRLLEQCPICSHCAKPIQDEDLWDINGELYHEACAEDEFKRKTEDYIE